MSSSGGFKNACQAGSPDGSVLNVTINSNTNSNASNSGRNGDLIVIDSILFSYIAGGVDELVQISITNGTDQVLLYQDTATATKAGTISVEFNNGFPIFKTLNVAGKITSDGRPAGTAFASISATVPVHWNIGYHFEPARTP